MTKLLEYNASELADHRSAQKHMEIDKTKKIWKWNKI